MEIIRDEQDFTVIFEKVGKWQIVQFLLLTASSLCTACATVGILVTGYQPHFRCAVPLSPGNDSSEETAFDDECHLFNATSNESTPCPYGFEYEGGEHVSFVSEWNLICEDGYLAELAQTCYIVGMAVGANTITHMADKFGRKPLLLVTGCTEIALFLVVAFIPNYVYLICLRFAIGFCNMGFYDMKIVLILEMFPVRLRGTMIVLEGLSWSIAVTILASLGYAFDGLNWRHIQLMQLASFVIMLPYYFGIDESVRWLVANGKFNEAENIIRNVKKLNGIHGHRSNKGYWENRTKFEEKELKETPLIGSDKNIQEHRASEVTQQEHNLEADKRIVKYNILDILKNKRTRVVILVMCLVWFTVSLTYYGLFLMTTAMSGDRLLNVLLSAAVEIPAMGGLYICIRWQGRRRGCIILHMVCGVALMLSIVFSLTTEGYANDILMKIVSAIGKFSISAAFMLVYLYTPELMPTNFRAAGLGLASGAGRLGSVLAPFSSFLFRKFPWAPGAVFGGLSLLVSGLLMLVPETEDKELPQLLEDIDQWGSKKDAR